MSSNTIENILIPQGGGSLGAFGCGVFKAFTDQYFTNLFSVLQIHLYQKTTLISELVSHCMY
jgi:hypothetical protein